MPFKCSDPEYGAALEQYEKKLKIKSVYLGALFKERQDSCIDDALLCVSMEALHEAYRQRNGIQPRIKYAPGDWMNEAPTREAA